jgi:DNA helicase-2/ATP-dependent DNA helicase PcrA
MRRHIRSHRQSKGLLSSLNPRQRRAVMALIEGNVLVVAGAGSGKTRVIVVSMATLVGDHGVRPESILLLTFTVRAAREMIRRASRLLKGYKCRVTGGTFHSFAARVLRKYGRHIELTPKFTIIDPADTRSILGSIRKDLITDDTEVRYPLPSTIASVLSKAINLGVPLKEVLLEGYPELLPRLKWLRRVQREYRRYKDRRDLLDFDDLLLELIRLLDSVPWVRRKLQRQFRYILADEYQDTNHLQESTVRLLSTEECHVMAVGDDSQAVYGWRGADHENLFRFRRHFPDARLVKLTRNYRSTQSILDVANAIQRQMERKFFKKLDSHQGDGPRPVLYEARDNLDEAEHVLELIEHHKARGRKLSELAVLYRANADPASLEIELAQANIPYVKYGGIRFLEAAHIKDLLCHLRVLVNGADEIAAMRVLGLCEGVGTAISKRIWEGRRGVPLHERIEAYLASCRGKSRRALGILGKLIERLANRGKKVPPAELLEEVIRYYKATPKIERDWNAERQHSLEQLVKISKRYRTAHSMLQELTIEPPDRKRQGDEEAADEDRVVLSTIHSAKGTEHDFVVILQAFDGSIPKTRIRSGNIDLDEELRLLYVGVTRAKRRLHVTWPEREPLSRFIEALPVEDLFTCTRFQ